MTDGLKMKYFVLKPAGDTPHAVACRAAMRQYATSIYEACPELAEQLLDWVTDEAMKASGLSKDKGS